jgi:hypothetical protein
MDAEGCSVRSWLLSIACFQRRVHRPKHARRWRALQAGLYITSASRRPGSEGIALPNSLTKSIGSTIDGPSFSGLLTRVEIGHIRMGETGTDASIREDQARHSASGRNLPGRGSAACGYGSPRPALIS